MSVPPKKRARARPVGVTALPSTTAGRPAFAVRLAERLSGLARLGIYLGTSSWKYPGWLGQVYEPDRYLVRGRHSKRGFDQECLSEYATVFPTVGGDFSFYRVPSEQTWKDLFAQLPPVYGFSLKVPNEWTVDYFPDIPRFGRRAGQVNPGFLDADAIRERLLQPLQPYLSRIGVIIFEFGSFHTAPLNDTHQFARSLERLFHVLPTRKFRFAVEVRNREFVTAGSVYWDVLREYGVAHCFSSWSRMPPVEEQLEVAGSFSAPHVAARFLLRPGSAYQQAVDRFAPYREVQAPYPSGRASLGRLIERCAAESRRLYAYVNNRLEGNAPETIDEVTAGLSLLERPVSAQLEKPAGSCRDE